MPNENMGTPYQRWVLTHKPYAPNLRASRVMRETVAISVSTNGVALEIELTPDQAREFSAAVFDLANIAEGDSL